MPPRPTMKMLPAPSPFQGKVIPKMMGVSSSPLGKGIGMMGLGLRVAAPMIGAAFKMGSAISSLSRNFNVEMQANIPRIGSAGTNFGLGPDPFAGSRMRLTPSRYRR